MTDKTNNEGPQPEAENSDSFVPENPGFNAPQDNVPQESFTQGNASPQEYAAQQQQPGQVSQAPYAQQNNQSAPTDPYAPPAEQGNYKPTMGVPMGGQPTYSGMDYTQPKKSNTGKIIAIVVAVVVGVVLIFGALIAVTAGLLRSSAGGVSHTNDVAYDEKADQLVIDFLTAVSNKEGEAVAKAYNLPVDQYAGALIKYGIDNGNVLKECKNIRTVSPGTYLNSQLIDPTILDSAQLFQFRCDIDLSNGQTSFAEVLVAKTDEDKYQVLYASFIPSYSVEGTGLDDPQLYLYLGKDEKDGKYSIPADAYDKGYGGSFRLYIPLGDYEASVRVDSPNIVSNTVSVPTTIADFENVSYESTKIEATLTPAGIEGVKKFVKTKLEQCNNREDRIGNSYFISCPSNTYPGYRDEVVKVNADVSKIDVDRISFFDKKIRLSFNYSATVTAEFQSGKSETKKVNAYSSLEDFSFKDGKIVVENEK